ncbi:MAG TPA: hypothetical protein VMQ50_10005 [Casimicrobiaceae bacterium]|nr:hypothetical protein [Casimicrobiaceae bacterium]
MSSLSGRRAWARPRSRGASLALPIDVDAVVDLLRRDAYDLELLISFGTSNGGSAGHRALSIPTSA